MNYWPTRIKEVIQWFYFQNVMDYTAEKIETEITLLSPLLKKFSMFQLNLWYKQSADENIVENVSIRCSNCGKPTVIFVKNINTNYNDIINQFVLNTVFHDFGMSWIIEKISY